MDSMENGKICELDFISIFEKCLSIKLPKSYRIFLKGIDERIPQKKYFSYGNDLNDGSILNAFFRITDDPNFDLIRFCKEYKEVLPPNMIPIADDQGGNLVLLCVNGNNYGKVYFLDHELPVILLADSFDEFINNLKSEDEIDLDIS